MPLHFSLLNTFSILDGDKLVASVDTPRLQSLLAYLLLHRDVSQPRQRLAFLLWPDTSDTQAQTNLRQLIHRLRAAFPQLSPYILTEGRTLQWNSEAPFTLDVMKFERLLAEASHSEDGLTALREAVELYRGDLLPDLYDEWVIGEREQLREKYLGALEALANGLLATGRSSEAQPYAERLKDEDPLRESAYRTIMEACSVTGDYSVAVRAYQECASILDREFGVQPSPTTQAIYRRILQLAAERQSDIEEPVADRLARKARTNLPIMINSFVGRQAEIAAVHRLFGYDTVRLVTLLGAPGVGKTRLALQVALGMTGNDANHISSYRFPDGVYMVSLSPVSDASIVASTIANVLSIQEQANRPIVETLIEWLGDKRLLLLLDNFEHMLGQGPGNTPYFADPAMLVSSLLASCAHLKVLVTSREPLKLYGEHEFPVPPLELPGAEEAITMGPARLGEYSAVKLFKERAEAVQHGFTLNAENTATVAAICRRLEALPLAIELAATRVKLMPIDMLLHRLEHRLNVLTKGSRDVTARHRTLRAAIEWSYDLLKPIEQQLFSRLAVFSGGSTLEAVVAVCGDLRYPGAAFESGWNSASNAEMADVLESLVSKSLVRQVEDSGGEVRFSMLETICEFAIEQLQAGKELEKIRKRHSSYFLALAERVESALKGPEQHLWLKHLEREHDNLRAAMEWSLQAGEITIALLLTGALLTFWERRAYLVEGRKWAEKVLALSIEPGLSEHAEHADLAAHRARVLSGMGLLAQRQGDITAARRFIMESLELYQEIGDKHGTANALNNMGITIADQFDLLQARSYHERSLALRRELDDKWGIALSINNLGITYNRQGDHEMARRLHEESLILQREIGNLWGIASALYMLADLATNYWADYTLATNYYSESLAIYRTLESKWAIAWVLYDLGLLARYQQEYARARSLYGESLLMFREILSKQGIAYVCLGLGQVSSRQGELHESKLHFSQSLLLFHEMDNTQGVLESVVGIAELLVEQGEFYRAGSLLGWTQEMLRSSNFKLSSVDMSIFTRVLSVASSHLDEQAWNDVDTRGRQWGINEAMTEALREVSIET